MVCDLHNLLFDHQGIITWQSNGDNFIPSSCDHFCPFIYSIIKGVSSMDEVQIRVQMEAVVIAFSLGLLMIMTLGLLDLVVILNKEDWGYRHLVPYFALFYFLGLFISKRKYSIDNEKHD